MKIMYNDRYRCKIYATIEREYAYGGLQSEKLNIDWEPLLELDDNIDKALRERVEAGARIIDVRRNSIYCSADIERAYNLHTTLPVGEESEPFLYMIETADIVFEEEVPDKKESSL